MNFKIIYTTLCFLTLICIHIDESMAQTNEGAITNINERILNKLEGLNTKINDLERNAKQRSIKISKKKKHLFKD